MQVAQVADITQQLLHLPLIADGCDPEGGHERRSIVYLDRPRPPPVGAQRGDPPAVHGDSFGTSRKQEIDNVLHVLIGGQITDLTVGRGSTISDLDGHTPALEGRDTPVSPWFGNPPCNLSRLTSPSGSVPSQAGDLATECRNPAAFDSVGPLQVLDTTDKSPIALDPVVGCDQLRPQLGSR